MRTLLLAALVLLILPLSSRAQPYSVSVGVYTGITIPYTYDAGFNRDPRFQSRYNIKFAPVGVNFNLDHENFGLLISPGITQLGQDQFVVNTRGGQDGVRTIDLTYLNLPVGLKFHLIDLSFFRVSAVATMTGAWLMKGQEKITFNATKLRFPAAVYPLLPQDYIIEYDGVLTPSVTGQSIVQQSDYRKLQLFAGLGFRSDWDVSDHWRVSFDLRANYGLFDPRTDAYLAKIKANQTLYDIEGRRHDAFVEVAVGVSRYIDYDKSDRDRKKGLKGSKKFIPRKSPVNNRSRSRR